MRSQYLILATLILCSSASVSAWSMNWLGALAEKQQAVQFQRDNDFSKKVDNACYVIADKALKAASNVPTVEVDRMINVLKVSNRSRTFKEIFLFFKRASQHVQDITGHLDESVHDQIRLGTLLKNVVGINNCTRKVLLELLTEIDGQMRYWEYEQKHPVHHFLHSNPLKNAFSMPEIGEKIDFLRRYQGKLYDRLGKLATQCDSFDENKPTNEMRLWLSQFFGVIHEIAKDESYDFAELHSYSEFFPIVQNELKNIAGLQNKVQLVTAHVKKPSYMSRNWLRSLGGAAAAAIAGSWLFKHKTSLPGWYQSTKNTLWSAITTPVKTFKSIFFDSREKAINDLKSQYKDVTKQYRDQVFNREQAKKVTDQDIEANAGKLDYRFLEDSFISEDIKTWQKMGRDAVAHDKNPTFKLASTGVGVVLEKLAGKTLEQKIQVADTVIDAAKDMVPLIPNTVALYQLYGRVCKESLEDQSKLGLAFGATFPIVLGAYGLWHGAKKLLRVATFKPDYKQIRLALVDISYILNAYTVAHSSEMLSVDYGKLIFLVEKLKIIADQLPDDKSARFKDDIKRLESPDLTAEKKMRVIDIMFRNYSFLTSANKIK